MSETVTFTYTGAVQDWVVPDGVTVATIECWGAQGGDRSDGSSLGGKGGYAKGDLAVTPGETLHVLVGQQGSTGVDNTVAFNGGGATSFDSFGGGGGGTDVRQGGTALTQRKIVAGGGGGASQSGDTAGVGGGTVGGDGVLFSHSGKGGTQSAGGASGYTDWLPGRFGYGASSGGTGSGGGGGWYGGGAGTPAGGGSGYTGGVTNAAMTSGVRTGDGLVAITYEPAPQTNLNVRTAGAWQPGIPNVRAAGAWTPTGPINTI